MALYYIEWIDYVSLIYSYFIHYYLWLFFSTNIWNIKLRGRVGGGSHGSLKPLRDLSMNTCMYTLLEMIFDCLFVCLFFVPLENFSLIWRHHHCRWRAANFDLCSALIVIEQWGCFSVPEPTVTRGIRL